MKIGPMGSVVVPWGRTDMTNLIVGSKFCERT